ncbi:unnamed protein product [Ectocarpus sp. 12 AP-2014]
MSVLGGGSSLDTEALLLNDLGASSLASTSSCRPFLKTKFQIGSVKGPKNFSSDQTVFHRDDVPATKRERKKEVKEWKERRILRMGRPPGWTSSVTLDPARMKCARTKSNSELDPGKPYQYNYRAEVLPPKSPDPVPKSNMFQVSGVTNEEAARRRILRAKYPDNALEQPKRIEEMPSNKRLDGKIRWNPSTQCDVRERRRARDEYEAACKLATVRKNGTLRNYTAPEQREKEQRQWIRKLKAEGRLWALKEREPSPLLPTHNRLAKDPIRRIRQYRHSGNFESREAEGCKMWSDTACFEECSPGDIIRVHNPAGFNFAAPCLTRSVARAWGST